MKKYLPHLIAIAVFIFISLVYFAPLFSGKELRQSDINNWKGMSQEIADFKEKTGENTYWTNSMFGGMPGYQIAAVYSANLTQYVNKVIMLGLPAPANFLFLLMAGFYFLLLTLKVDQKLAILGAVGYAFSSYFILYIVTGHNSKAHAIGFVAPIIAGIIMTYRGRLLLGAGLTTLFLALELYANHLQITYYLMLMVLILLIFEFYNAFKEKKVSDFIKASVFLGVGALFALMSNITNLWATQEYGKYSTRGPSELTDNSENKTTGLDRDYITQWSFGVGETFTLLIPNFKGGVSEPINRSNKEALKKLEPNFRESIGSSFSSYFGDQPFTGGPVYAGAIMVLLFVIGLFTVKGPLKWWLFIATMLSLMLSWGHNFMWFTNLFLDFVPGYDKFRAVTTIIVIAEFTIPLLGILAVNQMITEKDYLQKNKKKLLYAVGIVVGITLIICMSPGSFSDMYSTREFDQVTQAVKGQPNADDTVTSVMNGLADVRASIVTSDALRTLMFLIFGAALIWTYLKYRFNNSFLIFGLLVLVLMDLVSVDRRYLSADDFVKKSANVIPFPKTQADDYILQDPQKSFRVLNLAANTFNDASTSYYHQSIGGYHGAKLKRYKELIDYCIDPEISVLRNAMQRMDSTSEKIAYSQSVLNMLNTKYIIYNPEAPPLNNRGTLGNAWFVSELKWVANADSEIAAVRNFNPKQTVIVDQRFKDAIKKTSWNPGEASTITLEDYKPNHLTYTSKAESDQLAVFSEIYYDKGWNIYVDGQKVNNVRADYVLRAAEIPAGTHKVEWKFEPEVIHTGEKISFAGSALVLLFLAFGIWRDVKNKPTTIK